MAAIYFIDNNDIFRIGIVQALNKQLPGVDVHDTDDDVDYLRKVISAFRMHQDPSQIFAIIDVELARISDDGAWAAPGDSANVKKRSEFGVVEFNNLAAHGFNIYNKVRGLSGDIKIIILSTYSQSEMLEQRGNVPLPIESNLKYILRNDVASRLVEIIKDFFFPVEQQK